MSYLLLLVLLIPCIFFAYRHWRDYVEQSFWYDWKFGQYVGLAGFVCYLILYMALGVDRLYSFQNLSLSRNITTFFIAPGVGFALIIFPRVAAEFFSENVEHLVDRINFPAVIGWVLVSYTLLVILF